MLIVIIMALENAKRLKPEAKNTCWNGPAQCRDRGLK